MGVMQVARRKGENNGADLLTSAACFWCSRQMTALKHSHRCSLLLCIIVTVASLIYVRRGQWTTVSQSEGDSGSHHVEAPSNTTQTSACTCPPSLLVPPTYSKLEFIHIPKTGGTTAEVVAASHNVSWGACHWLPSVEASNGKCPPREKHEFVHHPDWRFSSWHVPIQYYNTHKHPDLFQWYRNASLFAIVRNPYDRIVSEWNYATLPKSSNRNNATAMNEYLSASITELHSSADNQDYKWWRKGDHWIRQVEFVTNLPQHAGPDHVYIVHYENLADEFSCLMHTFGMNWTWPIRKMNVARGHLTVANLTEQTKSLIASYFAPDFEKFGYHV